MCAQICNVSAPNHSRHGGTVSTGFHHPHNRHRTERSTDTFIPHRLPITTSLSSASTPSRPSRASSTTAARATSACPAALPAGLRCPTGSSTSPRTQTAMTPMRRTRVSIRGAPMRAATSAIPARVEARMFEREDGSMAAAIPMAVEENYSPAET